MISRPRALSRLSPATVIEPSGKASAAATPSRSGVSGLISSREGTLDRVMSMTGRLAKFGRSRETCVSAHARRYRIVQIASAVHHPVPLTARKIASSDLLGRRGLVERCGHARLQAHASDLLWPDCMGGASGAALAVSELGKVELGASLSKIH